MGSGKQVEYHVTTDRIGGQHIGAGLGHGLNAIERDNGQNANKLPVAVMVPGKGNAHQFNRFRQIPFFEWGPIPQCPRFLLQHLQVMPGVKEHLTSTETTTVNADGPAILHKGQTVGVGSHRDRIANSRHMYAMNYPTQALRGYGWSFLPTV